MQTTRRLATPIVVVTAIFMFYTFGPYGNAQPKYSWFIWAIAGILFGAVWPFSVWSDRAKRRNKKHLTLTLCQAVCCH